MRPDVLTLHHRAVDKRRHTPTTLSGAIVLLTALALPGSASAQTDALFIAPDGKVGIQTTSPEEALHVSGGRLLLDNRQYLAFKNSSGTVTLYATINTFDDFILGDGFGRA